MKHKGLSGFGIYREGPKVVKWTRGKDSKEDLKICYEKQAKAFKDESLDPIIAVMAGNPSMIQDTFSFEMPFLDCDTGFTVSKNLSEVEKKIRNSLCKRTNVFRSGFKSIIERVLLSIPESYITTEIHRYLESCPDIYPHGYAHGDFGLANMLIQNGRIFMVDFTPTFIASPLVDVATLELSLFSDLTKPWHLEMFERISDELRPYRIHISIIRMILVASYQYETMTKEIEADLRAKVYGRIK